MFAVNENYWFLFGECIIAGAFLIPYTLMILLLGIPLLFMEYGFGQYFGIGSLSIFKQVCPLFQGMSTFIGNVILLHIIQPLVVLWISQFCVCFF